MKPGRKKAAVDVQLMFRLWNNHNLSATEIATALGVSRSTMRNIAATYGLRCRKTAPRHREEDCAPSLADELRSLDSLALSPWVAAGPRCSARRKSGLASRPGWRLASPRWSRPGRAAVWLGWSDHQWFSRAWVMT